MKSIPFSLILVCVFAVSCKKDITKNIAGNYTGIFIEQDISGNTIVESLPIHAVVQKKPGDSVSLTIQPGASISFTHNLPVTNKSEFGYSTSAGSNLYNYEGKVKGDSLIYLYVKMEAPSPRRYLFKGKRD